MSALAPAIGDLMTPRVPMRRPLIDVRCADSGTVRCEDQRGAIAATPGLRLEIRRLIDSDSYALCSLPASDHLVLIKLCDLEIL